MKKGIFVILSGPSGVGKNVLVDELVKDGYGEYSVSVTTRNKRKGEIEGQDYFFINKSLFKEKIKEEDFFEWAIYNNNYYGTPKNYIIEKTEQGKNVIAIIEVQGTMKIKKVYPTAITIFIMPPSIEELERRLKMRNTDSEEDINRRLKRAKEEELYKDKYDYVVINDDIKKAVLEIEKIIHDNEK